MRARKSRPSPPARRRRRRAAFSPSISQRSKPTGARCRGAQRPSECAAVIKADGYGCGIEQVARKLFRAGCKTFFVADLAEAAHARSAAPEAAIYVLSGLMPRTVATFAELRARPVIGSLVELAEWDAFCSANRGTAARRCMSTPA